MQVLAAASFLHMSSRCLWPENGKNLTAGEEKMWILGLELEQIRVNQNPCAPLFQSPPGNADGLSSILLSLFLLKALLTLRGPHVY